MRGFGRQRLAPTAPACEPNDAGDRSCKDVVVGGLSLAETSAEVRYLPYLKPYGAVGFVDLGGASVQANPFREGANLATGVGLRLRFWYLPMALDGSFRVMEQGRWQALDQGRGYSVFFRIGEAY
jgi:outer membrane translocation and assembly module TamA